MRVGWAPKDSKAPLREPVRGAVYRDLRSANKPAWCDITSAGAWAIDPGDRFDPHYHDCHEYWLVAEGAALVQVGNDRVHIGTGDILRLERGRVHDILALDSPLRAFWFEGPVAEGGTPGSLHRNDTDAAGHVVASGDPSTASEERPSGEQIVVRELTGPAPPDWSDLQGAGSFRLERITDTEPHAQDCEEYWFVRGGSALVELDRERVVIEPGDMLCIQAGRHHRLVELYEPLLCFWLRRDGASLRPNNPGDSRQS